MSSRGLMLYRVYQQLRAIICLLRPEKVCVYLVRDVCGVNLKIRTKQTKPVQTSGDYVAGCWR